MTVEESDIEKYVLDQAKIEVEHNRSWPPKVMAFYVAINLGLTGSLIAAQKATSPWSLGCLRFVQWSLTVLTSGLAIWVIRILLKNHKNYLTYRNVQINVQQKFRSSQEKYRLPDDWFKSQEVRWSKRFCGWGFYAYIVVMFLILVIAVIWLVPEIAPVFEN